MATLTQLLRSLPRSELLQWSLLFLIVLLAVFGGVMDTMIIGGHRNRSSDKISKRVSLRPGELPGYTGWGRPEKTLAGLFSLQSTSRAVPQIGTEYVLTVRCGEIISDCGHEGNSLFFLRAYGPAVLSGIVRRNSRIAHTTENSYEVVFVFYDPGLYTIEVVLTVSNPPAWGAFPLHDEHQAPPYEGYSLADFPLLVTVPEPTTTTQLRPSSSSRQHPGTTKYTPDNACGIPDLMESSPNSALAKGRWVVTSKVNSKEYVSTTLQSNEVTHIGYATNVNSLGIQMEYTYNSKCRLLPETSFHTERDDQRFFSQCPETIHIVYIGDSVLRIQMETLQQFLEGSASVRFHFLSLHGGYRRNQILGPANIEAFLRDVQHQAAPKDRIVLLFNTGLHDIHRLCGTEFAADRLDYLPSEPLTAGTFTCVDEYRTVLRDFFRTIQEFPAHLKVFQSTTAAWPKYGNYGIGWAPQPERMPLVSDFSALFNEIAFEVLAEHSTTTEDTTITVMDGYWITYPRPDNRESGDIGKKLSHPGMEVLSVMTRKWAMLISDTACHP